MIKCGDWEEKKSRIASESSNFLRRIASLGRQNLYHIFSIPMPGIGSRILSKPKSRFLSEIVLKSPSQYFCTPLVYLAQVFHKWNTLLKSVFSLYSFVKTEMETKSYLTSNYGYVSLNLSKSQYKSTLSRLCINYTQSLSCL